MGFIITRYSCQGCHVSILEAALALAVLCNVSVNLTLVCTNGVKWTRFHVSYTPIRIHVVPMYSQSHRPIWLVYASSSNVLLPILGVLFPKCIFLFLVF